VSVSFPIRVHLRLSAVLFQEVRIHHSFPLQAGTAKIDDETDRMAGDFEVVEHLPEFVVGNAVYDLRVHYYGAERDEIRHVFANFDGLIKYVVPPLLFAWDGAQAELDDKSVLVRSFQQSMPEYIQYLEGAADNGLSLRFQDQSAFTISVMA